MRLGKNWQREAWREGERKRRRGQMVKSHVSILRSFNVDIVDWGKRS